MFEFQYIIIGIVQGVTEFLPISSSAHLVIISNIAEWNDQGIFTDIAVHGGTLGAVIIYFFSYIKKIFFDLLLLMNFSFTKNNNLAIRIIIATIPAIVIGFFVYEYLLKYLRNLYVIGWASIIFGCILFFADQKSKSVKQWEDLKFWELVVVGFFQVLAFIPGASRAGVTITAARFLNVKRDSAAIFSMLLSIPIISASLVLSLYDSNFENFSIINIINPFLATIISFITAILSIHMMMTILKYTNFNIFIIYRIILGITLLVFYA